MSIFNANNTIKRNNLPPAVHNQKSPFYHQPIEQMKHVVKNIILAPEILRIYLITNHMITILRAFLHELISTHIEVCGKHVIF